MGVGEYKQGKEKGYLNGMESSARVNQNSTDDKRG